MKHILTLVSLRIFQLGRAKYRVGMTLAQMTVADAALLMTHRRSVAGRQWQCGEVEVTVTAAVSRHRETTLANCRLYRQIPVHVTDATVKHYESLNMFYQSIVSK